MNQGLSQRENTRRSTTNVDIKGENAGPFQPNPALLSKRVIGATKLPGLREQGTHHPHRPILSDKSNKALQQSKPYIDIAKETTTTATTTKVTTNTTTITANVHVDEKITNKKEDTLDPIAITQEFFVDNQERYKPDPNDFIAIVPVLPIVVPDKLKHLYMNKRSLAPGKRPHDTSDELSTPDKRLKSTDLFRHNAPPLQLDLSEETIEYEGEQERRAKLAMLQTSRTFSQSQWNDPMLVADYADEIFGYMFDSEPRMLPDPTYALHQQHEISWRMRSVLVDWVIEIHYMFGLLPETLFLAVNIIDRFLTTRTVVMGKLQLVGITSLFIAAKFEEVICPSLQDFLFMTDKAVKEDELIKAERFIMQILDFRFCYPNPLNFLRRICTDEMHCDVHTRTLAKYFMEVACIDHNLIGVRPSKVAAASLWLSKKMLGKGKWNNNFTKAAGYAPEDLKTTVEGILDYLSQPVAHDAFFKKWSSRRLSKASIFVRDWINRYYIN